MEETAFDKKFNEIFERNAVRLEIDFTDEMQRQIVKAYCRQFFQLGTANGMKVAQMAVTLMGGIGR